MDGIRKINTHFIARVVGQMCFFELPLMLICLGVAYYYGNALLPFALGFVLYLLAGLALYGYGLKKNNITIGRREGMLSVTATWLVLSIVATVPILLSPGSTNNFWTALFETISGFTTTGATTYAHIDDIEHSILFWRALMQWQGGIGIVVFTVALIPMLSGGAGISQVFNAETTGITHDRFLPRISDVAKRLSAVYVGITALLFVLLLIGPMGSFDALCHALSTVSTGGYSTRTEGILAFDSAYVEYVIATFMFIGSLNIALIYFLLIGKPLRLILDEEFRWFSLFILSFTAITTWWLWHNGLYSTLEETFRRAFFQCTSLGSSTGFLTADISTWKPFFWTIALLLMFVNGCTGSTSGGMKMARFIVLVKNLRNEFKKQVRPHMLTPVIFNGRQVSISVVHQILAFCVLYVVLIFFGAALIMLDGNGFDASISIAVACISNSGPGIGDYVSSVAMADDFTKFVLSFLMLAGRLEVFTFIGILTPYFWKR